MRCLQCGKDIPLLKRLKASEFCSEAHRREYQQEYSQLALGRLLQANPTESQAHPLKAPPLAGVSAPALVESPATAATVNGAPATARSSEPAWAQTAGPATNLATPAPAPNKIAEAQTSVAIATTNAASQPATAQPAVVQKPAPAGPQFAPVAAPEFKLAFASLALDKPRRQADMLPAELPHGRAVPLESAVDLADSITRPMEPKLELREASRTTPRIALDLRIVPPESLKTESRSLAIGVAPAVPAEASLWVVPFCDFAGELESLNEFADAQFLKSRLEAPATGSFAVTSAAGPFLPESQAADVERDPPEELDANLAESQTAAPTPTVPIAEPQLNPLPVSSTGIAPGRAKPLPVFGPALTSTETVQIPQPNGLPLRPLMVLAAPATHPTEAKNRKTDTLKVGSAPSIEPAPQQSITPPAALNLGLPELRTEDPAGAKASRLRRILAALGGAALLGAGFLFFVSQPRAAGLKPPAHALADGASGSQWIANFAPDAKRQRRVSLLRSSTNLSAYRLDFESSIQIKALGWVYRARDSKNFYVGKIEFQKPGVNPVYALVHYAVINGVEQARMETPLHVSVPMGGVYKIRFEAVRDRFTTWVQGQQVEQWTDSRLSSGGAGLYGEGSEQSTLHGDFVVTPLLKEK